MSLSAPTASIAHEDVYVTDEMYRRAASPIDHRAIKEAIQELAVHMVDGPERVLPRFVALAMEVAGGVSSGISIAELEAKPARFRWAYLQGTLAAFDGATTPRDFSPCGITLDQDAPVLTRHSELMYPWIAECNVVLPEVLLVPLHRGSEQLGTLWIVSDKAGHFNPAHVDAVTEIAAFVSIALRMQQVEERLSRSLTEQESLAKEMSHRVKNVFNIVDGIIHLSGRRTKSKEELVESLSGRVRALAVAHGMVRRTFHDDTLSFVQAAHIGQLVRAIVRPYEAGAGEPRFLVEGPDIEMGDHASNGVALVLHELATNAAKYGALSRDAGNVQVRWQQEGNELQLSWKERGGPIVGGPPEVTGFGSRLVRETIQGTLGGKLEPSWLPEGLEIAIRLPIDRLQS